MCLNFSFCGCVDTSNQTKENPDEFPGNYKKFMCFLTCNSGAINQNHKYVVIWLNKNYLIW